MGALDKIIALMTVITVGAVSNATMLQKKGGWHEFAGSLEVAKIRGGRLEVPIGQWRRGF